jgi:hypothetical protein
MLLTVVQLAWLLFLFQLYYDPQKSIVADEILFGMLSKCSWLNLFISSCSTCLLRHEQDLV